MIGNVSRMRQIKGIGAAKRGVGWIEVKHGSCIATKCAASINRRQGVNLAV
jgi:hypothetical protein